METLRGGGAAWRPSFSRWICGINDPRITYELSVGEGSKEADLRVGLGALSAAGIGADEALAAADDVSRQILDNTVARKYVDEARMLHFAIV